MGLGTAKPGLGMKSQALAICLIRLPFFLPPLFLPLLFLPPLFLRSNLDFDVAML